VDADVVAVVNVSFAGYSELIPFNADFNLLFFDAGHLGNHHQVVTLLEDIDRWESPAAGRGQAKPVTVSGLFERTLNIQQSCKWITESGNHSLSPSPFQADLT
jgi:hypothetical protein